VFNALLRRNYEGVNPDATVWVVISATVFSLH
jgi:hypothetical protein